MLRSFIFYFQPILHLARCKKQLIWQPKTEEIAFVKRTSDPRFADFLSCQILRVLTKIYLVLEIWSRLVCFCTSINAKSTGQSKNVITFIISTLIWELESFKVHPFQSHEIGKMLFFFNKGWVLKVALSCPNGLFFCHHAGTHFLVRS